MNKNTPLGLVLFAAIFSLFFGIYLFRSGWRFWTKGIYASFLEELVLKLLGFMKGEEAAQQHRMKLQSPGRKRFNSFVNIVVGGWLILIIVGTIIVVLVIQLA